MTRDGTVEFREDIYKHDVQLDPATLDEIAAGGFVASIVRSMSQTVPPPVAFSTL